MKKTLIALAVLGAVGAAHAQSNVTIYGQLNPSYDVMKAKDGAVGGGDLKTNGMNDNASRIGFKGTEDLGNGLKAVFQLESYFDMVSGDGFNRGADAGKTTKAGSRDSFAGLQGNWGTFRLGTFDPVYKKITASYDPFGDTINDYNMIMGVAKDVDLNGRYKRVAGYISPNVSGFQGMIDYSWEKTDDDEAGVGKNEGRNLSLGATYTNGPLQILAAYALEKTTTNDVDGEDLKAWKIGASYKLPTKTTVRAIYENLKQDGVVDTKHLFLGVEHPINNIDLLATFIWADDNDELATSKDTGAKAYNLGVRYNFSKRTNITGMYSYLKNDDNGTYENDAGYAGNIAGATISGVSVRLQHKF